MICLLQDLADNALPEPQSEPQPKAGSKRKAGSTAGPKGKRAKKEQSKTQVSIGIFHEMQADTPDSIIEATINPGL